MRNKADKDIAVYGSAVPDEDFIGGSDRVRYQIDISESKGPYTINVYLHFTTVSANFIDDLKKDQHLPEVKRFLELWQNAKVDPVVVGSVEKTVE